MSFDELIENVKKWSVDKSLHVADPRKQMQKLSEEWGELNAGKAKSDKEKLIDSIGDVLVVLTILSQQMNFEKIERLIDPKQNGTGYYLKDDEATDLLLLYGTKEIGMMANSLIDLSKNPGIINIRVVVKFHIRILVGMLYRIAINEGTDLETCFETAWNEIADRKGEMVDGMFVKEADL